MQLQVRQGYNDDRQAPWHASTADSIVLKLASSAECGLAESAAGERLTRHGPNALQAADRTRWPAVLARQFADALIVILLIAALISAAIGEPADAVTILAIVVLNGIVGFIQEWKAERAIGALRQMLQPLCRVVRGGIERDINTEELVPGDVVVLDVGDHVPADLRLLHTVSLKIDESALTGESAPVEKHPHPVAADAPLAERGCIAWMGTAVSNGRARGIVIATGMNTEFGRIAALTSSLGRERTPLQHKLAALGRQIGAAAITISILIGMLGWVSGRPAFEMFMVGVSLAVAIVPEGLPVVVTLTLAFGVRAMVRHRALLRRLQAAETLGSASVICTDKTGTLTRNEMTAQVIWLPGQTLRISGAGYEPRGEFSLDGTVIDARRQPALLRLLRSALLCNNASLQQQGDGWSWSGDPTELALVVAAAKAGLLRSAMPATTVEFSFNANRKRMTVIEPGEAETAHVKGAPEVILERSRTLLRGDACVPLDDDLRRSVLDAYHDLASQGLRVLAVAVRPLDAATTLDADNVEQQLTLLGLVGIVDPPRNQVSKAIQMARRAGIRSIMVTGDAPATALAIARMIGLPADRAVLGTELQAMSDAELVAALRQDVLFARTTPEDKLRIVTALQELGNVVGMTGDGVNDAPALKRADIGIAMGIHGTDVARAAADMVLTDDNFASIVRAVREGRRQYDNIRKFVQYLLSSNSGEVIAIFANVLMGGPLILLPVQILWMNLVTDGMTAIALGVEPAEKKLMERPPRSPTAAILDRHALWRVLTTGTYIGLATLFAFNHLLGQDDPNAIMRAQTVAFTTIILCEKMNVFNFRSLHSPLSTIGYFSNPWVLFAWVGTISLQFAAIYTPFLQGVLHTTALTLRDWLLVMTLSLPVFLVTEGIKRHRTRIAEAELQQG